MEWLLFRLLIRAPVLFVVKNFGVAKTLVQQNGFIHEAQVWIKEKSGLTVLDLFSDELKAHHFLGGIKSLRKEGIELALDKPFDGIGFNKIKDTIFKQLVL